MTDVLPDETTTTVADGATRPFEALMAVEGRWTGDDRFILVDALGWDGLLPFLLTEGHGAELDDIQGWLTEIERVPGMSEDERFIVGRGVLYTESRAGADLVQQLEAGAPIGVSVDLDALSEGGVDPEDPNADPMAWYMVVESARIRSLATVAIPAFAESLITLGTVETTTSVPPLEDRPMALPSDELPTPEIEDPEVVIVAAAGHTITIPRVPPAEWFDEPSDVAIEGALTVTDDGRVYGLLAPANVPFLGNPNIRGVPMGNVDYSRFRRGEAIVEGGGRVVAGNITMGCGHSKTLTRAAAIEHHDNSCAVVAQVNVGERYASPAGVWVAGALVAGVTAEQVQRMTTLALSGEWAPTPDGGYELLNALLVPMPAFMMGRRAPSVTMHDGAIAASAIPVQFEDCGCGGGCEGCADERSDIAARLAAVEGIAAAALAAEIREDLREAELVGLRRDMRG